MRYIVLSLLLFAGLFAAAQKQPLDHTVYDGWQSIGEKIISHNGRFLVYTINPQEGDGVLIIQDPMSHVKKEIPRGYRASITADNRFVIGLIKPRFKETREARIKKKKAEEMPKDSLFVFDFDKDSMLKVPRVKSYQMPDRGAGWLAWLSFPDTAALRSHLRYPPADSSIITGKGGKTAAVAAPDTSLTLTLRDLTYGTDRKFPATEEYAFSKKGNAFAVAMTKKPGDSTGIARLLWINLPVGKTDTVMRKFNEVRNLTFDETGDRLVFVAERDSALKALRKFYNLWYYAPGRDSATMLVSRNSPGVAHGLTVSENRPLLFARGGHRLLLGLAPIRPVKDTTIPDFEKASVDIWNYNDDDLQPVQLKNLDRDLKRSWLTVLDLDDKGIHQLGDEKFPEVEVTGEKEGDGDWFYAASDFGKRIARQWQGYTLKDVCAIDTRSGEKKLITRDLKGDIYPSVTGKYLLLYDEKARGYSVYNSTTGSLTKVGADIRVPLYNEEYDEPDDPNPYGIAGWEKEDKHVLIYDRYDIWSVDPAGKERSLLLTPSSRSLKNTVRWVRTDTVDKAIDLSKPLILRIYDETHKNADYARVTLPGGNNVDWLKRSGNYNCVGLIKADSADVFVFAKETFIQSPDLYVEAPASHEKADTKFQLLGSAPVQLSHLNPQQDNYFWGTAELFKWKAYTGRQTEGILYKPEGFDPAKKYPMIVYFYERNNNTLYNYQAPAPTPSRLNIPFFVSRGYLVFVPDIWYRTGHPGKSAYDYIVSGTRALIKKGFVDSTKLGIQGQSWGGYQTAYVITRTNLFAAAWAGAPVVDMFSAYGGIRWESGYNRQMQYEHGQSRIGATIWERPDLYVENSPLFHLKNIKTPLVIMSNDADGAVPWYQGIEFFTAMRRLGKPVWLLQYNGEAHNLVERRNRKDIQIREQQYFDWLLKGAPEPKWLKEGVPATLKGIDWGTEIE